MAESKHSFCAFPFSDADNLCSLCGISSKESFSAYLQAHSPLASPQNEVALKDSEKFKQLAKDLAEAIREQDALRKMLKKTKRKAQEKKGAL